MPPRVETLIRAPVEIFRREVSPLIARPQFYNLRREAWELGANPNNFHLVADLGEVLLFEPYSSIRENGDNLPVTLCDLDGVVTSPSNNRLDVIEKSGIKELGQGSGEFVFFSGRFTIPEELGIWNQVLRHSFGGSFTRFPILTIQGKKRLCSIVKDANPECAVEVWSGPEKLSNNGKHSKFAQVVAEGLRSGRDVAYIGSGLIDRRIIIPRLLKNISTGGVNLKNFHYFDTQHAFF